MSDTLAASTEGLEIVDRARQRQGWTKTSTARWWQDAHTSRATLRRFWQGDRIQREIFIALCEAVGISNWETIADTSTPNLERISSYLDWDEAPDVDRFYGRDRELNQLEQWLTSCKLITIVGLPGIGKTALALAFADRVQSQFEGMIWRSLSTTPSLFSLLDSLNLGNPIETIQQGATQLIHHLQRHRYLLILDGLEAVLSQDYQQFLQQLSQARHQSCILLTSSEQPAFLDINSKTSSCLKLQGLQENEAVELLQSFGFTGKELGLGALVWLYRGNPLGIKLVIPLLQSIFGGNVAAFLNQNTLAVGVQLGCAGGDRFQVILKQQFQQLTDLERDILYWLAIWQEPISFCRLQSHFLIAEPGTILEGIASLERRSLLEKWNGLEIAFTLQPLVMKEVTDELVDSVLEEIERVVQSSNLSHFKVMRSHRLLRPGTDDIAGDRILKQLREKLWRVYNATLPQTLQQILLLLSDQSPLAVGYIGYNVTAILKPFGLQE